MSRTRLARAVSLLSDECPADRSDAGTTPSADFCIAIREPHGRLSPELPDTVQISRVKFDRLPRTLPNLPRAPLMAMGLVVSCRLVRPAWPPIRFLYLGSRFCSALPSDDASRRRPCTSLPFTSIRLGEDLHLKTVKHARQTRKDPLTMAVNGSFEWAARDSNTRPLPCEALRPAAEKPLFSRGFLSF